MENLTKENFFNEMKTKYPKAMDHFCAWIDEYKKSVNWEKLFNAHPEYKVNASYTEPAVLSPKYHDLPIAMQAGILLQYAEDHAVLFDFIGALGFEIKTKLTFEKLLKGAEPKLNP